MSIKNLFSIAYSNFSNNVRYMAYKSNLAKSLYPESAEIKPFKPPESVDGKFTGYIPIKEIKITSMHSSGPGGQNVNKLETKVDVRFHVQSATWLSDSTKEKLMNKMMPVVKMADETSGKINDVTQRMIKWYTRINKEGYFIVRSEKTRSKLLNTADALSHIREIIFKLEEPPSEVSPELLEKHRKNKEKAARIRIMEKKYHSLIKKAKI